MSFEIVQGDLFDPDFEFDALAQGVNTQGLMGAGIAVAFKDRWPAMYEDYKDRCLQFGPSLGGLVHIYPHIFEAEPTIYNMFSQIMPGRNGDYRLLQQAAITVLMDAEVLDYERVGMPWIGCGIAGLEKHNVEHIFNQVFDDSDVEFILVQQDEIHAPVNPEEVAHLQQNN